jgi:hypothetical protein
MVRLSRLRMGAVGLWQSRTFCNTKSYEYGPVKNEGEITI